MPGFYLSLCSRCCRTCHPKRLLALLLVSFPLATNPAVATPVTYTGNGILALLNGPDDANLDGAIYEVDLTP